MNRSSLNKKSRSKSRSRSISKSKSNKGSRERSSLHKSNKGGRERSSLRKSKKEIPNCRPVVYCGKNALTKDVTSTTKYDKIGKREECFKKGIGIGMMIEMEKIKKKLASKGIVLVLPKKKMETCMGKDGNTREQYKKEK